MHRNLKKISITVSPDLVSDLDFLSQRTGVSRSALITSLLAEAVPEMRKFLEQLPMHPEPADVVRFRGESEAVVRARIEDLKGLADDVFSQ